MEKIKILIIDDSALIRQILSKLFAQDPELEVVGVAADPIIAQEKIKELHPDVLTLDVEMPRMDGLTFLKQLMSTNPMPVLMISSLTEEGAATTFEALELGAIDFTPKPKIDIQAGLEGQALEIIQQVKAVAKSSVKISYSHKTQPVKQVMAMTKTTDVVVAIGSSTGGVEALKSILMALPPDSPPVMISQHMPAGYTKTFAERLNSLCQVLVKEASHGDRVIPGQVLIAPGDHHLLLQRSGAQYRVTVNQNERVNLHRPSVDVMLSSVAKYAGKNSVGVILTGMGNDGAKGMLQMKQSGAYTLAQDEESCVVFGMPKAAITLGGIHKTLPLTHIASELIEYVNQ